MNEIATAVRLTYAAEAIGISASCGRPRRRDRRIRGLRANASRASHAELDEAEELDRGDAVELAAQYRSLQVLVPGLTILGGCCGTDSEHVAAITTPVPN